jgi:exosortase/archaeosortase family protein
MYVVKFLLFFVVLYYFNVAFIGATAPGNTYISFLDKYLNYIDWLRYSILHTSNGITRLFDHNTYVKDPYLLKIYNGPGVQMVYSCIGYGVMSFWVAFVLANKGKWQQKILWALGGCFCIWVINCFRVATLLMAIASKWNVNKYMNHHTMFNIFAYILILVLMYFYTQKLLYKTQSHTNFSGQ